MKKKKSIVNIEGFIRKGEALYLEYEQIEKEGTWLDIPDGEHLLQIASSIHAIQIQLQCEPAAGMDAKNFAQREMPTFHRGYYMVHDHDILSEASAILNREGDRLRYLLKEITEESQLGMKMFGMRIEGIFECVELANSLQSAQRTSQQEMQYANILVTLRKFTRREKSNYSLLVQYLTLKKRSTKKPEKTPLGQQLKIS